jgi:hypothetical protein
VRLAVEPITAALAAGAYEVLKSAPRGSLPVDRPAPPFERALPVFEKALRPDDAGLGRSTTQPDRERL